MKLAKFPLILFLTALVLAPVSAEPQKSEVGPTPTMSDEAKLLVSMLEQAHFSGNSLAELEIDQLLTNYMSDLDYHRLFFHQGDFEEFEKRYGPTLERNLRKGNLDPAFSIFERYRQRALERIDWILVRLDEEFDFDSDRTFTPDRREAEWPANSEEADDLWERRLTYELLAGLLNDEPEEETVETVRRRYDRLKRSILEMDSHEVQEAFLSSFSKLYDPHSSFLSASTLEDFSISMRLSLVGIGALLRSEDGYCTIQELIAGGPAAIDGQMRPNDRIVAVAQDGEEAVDVIDMKLRRVVEMIRGKKGTKVHLTVIPADAPDSSTRETITLVRDEIRLTASRAKAKIYEIPTSDDETIPVGVISVPSFYGNVGPGNGESSEVSTTDDVAELIGKLEEAGIQALMLDLRRNGGGLLTEAIRMTGLFIEGGPVVRVKSPDGRVRVDPDKDPDIAYRGPLAVLVSRNSASASEIVAGALQNYGRALILGENSTHGKGTVQAIFELDNYLFQMGGKPGKTGAAKLTVQKFYLPDGGSTQSRGVVPDIVFPSFNEHAPIGEADLPNALAWDRIDAPDWKDARGEFTIPWTISSDSVQKLAAITEERQKELEEFQYLREYIEWFREKQEEKAVSLNLAKRQETREIDKKFREQMGEIEERLAEHDFPAVEFVLDEQEKNNDSLQEQEEPEGDDIEESILRRGGEGNLDVHLRESLRIVSDLIRKIEADEKRVAAHKSS